MAPTVEIRDFALADYDDAVALWQAAGIAVHRGDDREALELPLERDADFFFVAEDRGRSVGVVMGCYDGRRGGVNHLAVAPERQGQGLGAAIMAELERRLVAKGCEKVNLLIEPDNAGVQAFYEKLSYSRDPLIFMEKWLT